VPQPDVCRVAIAESNGLIALGTSSEVPLFVVPDQRLDGRPIRDVMRKADARSVQSVVVAAVLELLFDAGTDLETILGSDRDVAGVEEIMDVGAEPDPACWSLRSGPDGYDGIRSR